MTEAGTTEEFETCGLTLRAVFQPDQAIEFEDDTEICDVWIWFVASADQKRWYAFALSDTTLNPDEILGNSPIDVMEKVAIWIGDPWEAIEEWGAYKMAKIHRACFKTLDQETLEEIREANEQELTQMREEAAIETFNKAIATRNPSQRLV